MGHDNRENCGWSLSWIFYVLAIIALIVAIILGIVAGVKNGDDVDDNVQQNWHRAQCFFLLAIALALLAIYVGATEVAGSKGGLWG